MSFFDRLKAFFGATSRNGGGAQEDMISCDDALRLVHEYLDGELEDVPRARVKAHFEVCQQCYPHLRLENAFREAVRRAGAGQTAPPELRDKLLVLLAEADEED